MSRARRGSQASIRRRNRASLRSRGLHNAERLELRTLMAGDVVNPFHNAHFAADVNGDWKVTSLDAVLIINNLNASGTRELNTPAARMMAQGEGTETSPEYLDVNGDGFLTPLDALLVINHLNAEGADPAVISYRNVVRDPVTGQELAKTGAGTTADPYVYAVAPGQRFVVTTEYRDNRVGTLDAPAGADLYNTAPLGLFETFSDLFFDSSVAKLGFSEVQRLSFTGLPTGSPGASMTLTIKVGADTLVTTGLITNLRGGTTINRDNTAFLISNALNAALEAADAGQVTVTRVGNTDAFDIRFQGKLVDVDVAPLVVSGLSGGATANVTTLFDVGSDIDLGLKENIVRALNYNALYSPELDPAGQRFLELYTLNASGTDTGILRVGGRANGDTAVSPRNPLPSNPDEYTDYMRDNFVDNDGYMIVAAPVFVAQGAGSTFINTDAPGEPDDPSNHGITANLAIGNVTGANPLVTQDRIAYPAMNSVKIVILADVTADDDLITTINEDAPATNITAQILDGDTNNQNADPLNITGFGPNGTDQTFTIAGQGTVSLNAGVVTFTPALNFAGNFVFQYGLTNDGTGTPKDFGLVTIAVNPVNDAPTAQPGSTSTNEDVFVDIDLRSLVSDIETPVANLTFTFNNVVNGSVQILNGHTARFTPAGNFNGVGSFSYTVTDAGQGASAALSASNTVTITVNPVNDAPVVTPVTQTTAEDTSINIDLASFVTDIETADGALVFSSVSVTNGTLTLVSGSTYTFTPAQNFNGTAVLSFSVTDTGDGSSPATTVGPNQVNITVTPVDDPGTAPNQTVNVVEDVPTVLTLTGVTGGPADESQVVTLGLTSGTTAQGGLVEIVNNQIRYTSPANFYSQRYGNDTFSYTVTDSSGAVVTGQITVVVAPDTIDPPQANDDGLGLDVIEIPDSGVTVLPLSTLLANDSNEPDTPDNNNLTVTITDVTGLPAGVTVDVNNATQELIIDTTDFQVPQSGDVTATFKYTITDVDGNTDTATVTITLIPNTLPRAVDDSYTFSETDIESDNTRDLNVIDGTLRPDRPYEDFDALRIVGLSTSEVTSTDGTINVGGITFTIDPTGRFITMTAPVDPDFNGTFVLYYTLDEPGATVVGDPPVQDIGKVTITITPVNDAPTASPTSATLNEDAVYTIDLRTLVSDLETSDDAMTFSVSGAQNGTVTLDADGHTARFTPNANYSGPASFTYTATDGGDGTSPALTTAPQTISLTYNPVNDAPVVTPITLTTNEDTDLLIDLATLVSDVETADADLVFTNVTVTNGAIVHVSGSTYRYTPTSNFSGTATLSFDVTDTGQVGGDAATVASGPLNVTVNPVNDAPTANPDSDTTLEDTAITFNLRDLVSDVETPVANLTFAVSSPVGGTVVLEADGFTARFTPNSNFNGNASFTYTVTDGGQGASAALSASAQISITVTPDNDAPVVTPAAQTTAEDTALLIDLATMVSDVETSDANLVFSDVVVTNGTIELVSGSTYRYTPTANYNGPAQLTFKVTDTGDGADAPIEVASGPIAITVTPVNDAPVATGSSQTLGEDTVFTIDLRTLVTDVETDGATRPFTFSVSNAVNGTVVLDADGFTARFTPTADYFGPASFRYTATDDGDNGAAAKTTTAQTISLTYTSVNDAPRPVADTFTTFKTNNSGPTTLYDVLPNDIANQPFGETSETLTLTGATVTTTTPAAASPNLPTVSVENGKLRFQPNGYAGTVVVTYTVSDGTLSSTATATFTVRDFEPGVISGYVYADADGDMVMDGQVANGRPERRLSDVEVWLVGKVAANVDPSQPTIAVMTRTDATGRFVFNNDTPGLTQGLPPGTYVVQLDNPNTPAIEGAELTIDSPDSIKSVTVPNMLTLPAGTGATVLGNNKIQVSFTELGINAELNLAVQGLAPKFMSIRDHLNTSSPYGVVFAVNTADQSAAGHQYWYSIYENVNQDGSLLSNPGWYGFQSLKLQVSANLSTAVLTAVDANGATWTRTLSFTADYTKIRVMGSEGSNVVVRLEGSWTDFFPSAATVSLTQQTPPAGEGHYAEGEGAAYAAAADEIYAGEAWA